MENLDIKSFALGVANGDGGGYPEPEGTKNITSNGVYNIKDFAEANVNVDTPDPDLVDITITENGKYTHPNKDGYDEVTVNVPIPPTPTGTLNITENGTYDVTNKATANVNVEGGGYPEPTGTISISQNGTANVKDYASANVNVPNSYSSSDNGKVVSNGSLVSQTATTKTENGTYDTTLNNSVTINVPTDEPDLEDITITQNGTYESTEHDGFGEVTVNVSGGSTPQTGCVVSGGIADNVIYYDMYGYQNYYYTSSTIRKGPPVALSASGIAETNKSSGATSNKILQIRFRDSGVEYIPNQWFSTANPTDYLGKFNRVFLTFPNTLKYIGQKAFSGVPVSSAVLPSSLQQIGKDAFAYTKLKNVTIPENVTSVATSAYSSISTLQTVTFEGTPNSIGALAFEQCSNLTDIYVPWSQGAISGAPWGAPNATVHYNWSN